MSHLNFSWFLHSALIKYCYFTFLEICYFTFFGISYSCYWTDVGVSFYFKIFNQDGWTEPNCIVHTTYCLYNCCDLTLHKFKIDHGGGWWRINISSVVVQISNRRFIILTSGCSFFSFSSWISPVCFPLKNPSSS